HLAPREDLNWKGVGETLVSPWRNVWENRGFPRSSCPLALTIMNLTPKIIYEDEDILAINKPAGLVVHPDGRTEEPSVSEWFAAKYPESKDVGEPIRLSSGREVGRPGIVHRIDRETSGVLLLAKT